MRVEVLVWLVGALCWASTSLAGETAGVTFTKDIAPLVYEHCASCHREGESAPFPLLTYEDVRSHASQIAEVTASRFMPPWLPASGHGDFLAERRLTAEQIQLIKRWVQAGAPEGDPGDLPPEPEFTPGWQLGEPDLVVTLPPTYTLSADGLDVYRNFVLPVEISETKWVRAIELRFSNPRPVHHAFALVDSSSGSRRRDEEDALPGFAGMETGSAYGPAAQFISWQPGKVPSPGDDQIAWRLRPGTDLVLQLHMQPTGRPEPIGASVGLFFADMPGTKHPQKIALFSKDIDIPAGEANYTIHQQYRLPVDVDVLAILPHAHYLAKRMEAFARLPDGSKKWLILIEDWDFNWQGDYQYREPVHLPAGAVLTMQYTYDNSAANVRNPHHPPRRVTYGLNSTDEMGELWLQVLPSDPADGSYLHQDIARHALTQKMDRCRQLLQVDPQDVKARIDLAQILLAFNKVGEAEAHLSRAVELAPDSTDAHYLYGYAHLRQQRFVEAEQEFQRALAIDPQRLEALHDLGLLYLQKRQPAQAETFFRRAIEVGPYDAVSYANLALSLLQQKKIAEAAPYLEQAMDLDPTDEKSRARLELVRQALQSIERP